MQKLVIACLVFFAVACNSKDETSTTAPAENWVLAEKNRYEYKLNSMGHPDTTYVYTQKYKDGLVTDSSITFIVNKYEKEFLSDEITYVIDGSKKPIQHTATHYTFDKKGRNIAKTVYGAGKVIMDQRFVFNDSNLIVKSISIQIKNYDLVTGGPLELATASAASIGYDTLVSVYEYDKDKKVVGTNFLDSKGNVVSKDVTLYSGNDPLLSANVSAKGDTMKRITYEKRDKILMTVTETDSLVLFQNFANGVQIAQKTKYKNRNEQWRSAVKFDQYGRKIEETLYKML